MAKHSALVIVLLAAGCATPPQPQTQQQQPPLDERGPSDVGQSPVPDSQSPPTPPAQVANNAPATLELDSFGAGTDGDERLVAKGPLALTVRITRTGEPVDKLDWWIVDFAMLQWTFRCKPTFAKVVGQPVAELGVGDETTVQVRCDEFAALNGSPRASLWPGIYRTQIQVRYQTTGGQGRSVFVAPFKSRVDGKRAVPPAKAARTAKLGAKVKLRVVSKQITQRTVPQGIRGRAPLTATNLRFKFEIDNRTKSPLVVTDWELFVVDKQGAHAWDAVVITPDKWDRTVKAKSKQQVELVDGAFPPRLTNTSDLAMFLRLETAAGNSAWIASKPFDVTAGPTNPKRPPPR